MIEMTPNQQKYVVGRKAARISGALVIFGGAIVFLLGLYNAYLPEVLEGVVFLTSSILFFVVAKWIERKLSLPPA